MDASSGPEAPAGLDPGFRDDPYPALARLREEQPVRPNPGGTWTVSRHADVVALLRDRRMGRAPARWTAAPAGWDAGDLGAIAERWLLFLDPPEHARLRTALSPAFAARAVARHRPVVEEVASGLLDALAGREAFDLLTFAKPFPLRVLCRLLGIPARDRRRLQRLLAAVTNQLARRVDLTAAAPGGAIDTWAGTLADRPDEGPAGSGPPPAPDGSPLAQLDAHLLDLVRSRADGAGAADAPLLDDLLDAGLAEPELVAAVAAVLVAGHETVANAVANGVLAVQRDPEAAGRLRHDPSLLPTAADEVVRYDGPANLDYRIALEPVELHGHRIAAGELVLLLLGAANRDPAAFPDPDRLVLDRHPNPHVGYGTGAHRCLGVWLARLELEVALGQVATRWPDLAVDEERVVWRDVVNLRALARLPVRTTP